MNTCELKIEHGVQMPQRIKGRPTRYPFCEMEVGDSVLIPKSYATDLAVRSALIYARRRFGFRFSYRKNSAGIRVWRVA